jgi:hypothetical protein
MFESVIATAAGQCSRVFRSNGTRFWFGLGSQLLRLESSRVVRGIRKDLPWDVSVGFYLPSRSDSIRGISARRDLLRQTISIRCWFSSIPRWFIFVNASSTSQGAQFSIDFTLLLVDDWISISFAIEITQTERRPFVDC